MSGEADLSTIIAGIKLKHPVMNASGVLGAYPEHVTRLAEYGVAAVVTKTFTVAPREGYGPPIIVGLRCGGYLNAVGLANPGVDELPKVIKKGVELGLPIVVSVGGSTVENYVKVGSVALDSGANALELNLSCPHTKGYGLDVGSDPSNVFEMVEAVASVSSAPVIVKLGLSDNYVKSAGKALEAGAKALTLINTVRAMLIDVYSLKPVLSNVFGGLSGPPIHPIAVRAVYEVYREFSPEIIGVGGVVDWTSAAELILAGAKAVQVGSALALERPKELITSILEGLKHWITGLGYSKVSDLVGLAHRR